MRRPASCRGVGRLSVVRPWPSAVLVLSIALAGCSGGEGGGDPSGSTSVSQTSTGPGLVAAIQVLINGTAAAPTNGSHSVDAGATVTFDGSNSTGAIVEFLWDFGDNTTGTDETETHSYAAGGSYDVSLTVKGRGNATDDATVRIQVAADESGGFLFTQAQTFDGDLPLANPNACMNQGIDCQDHVVTVVAADANGTAALANNVTLILDGSGATAVHMQLFWRSPDGTTLAQTAADGLDHTLTYSGDMPPGDYVVRVRLFVGAQASYTGAVAVSYVSA